MSREQLIISALRPALIHPEWRGLFYSNDRLTLQQPLILLALILHGPSQTPDLSDHIQTRPRLKYETTPAEIILVICWAPRTVRLCAVSLEHTLAFILVFLPSIFSSCSSFLPVSCCELEPPHVCSHTDDFSVCPCFWLPQNTSASVSVFLLN